MPFQHGPRVAAFAAFAAFAVFAVFAVVPGGLRLSALVHGPAGRAGRAVVEGRRPVVHPLLGTWLWTTEAGGLVAP
ncbi:hypothetical protein [Streptomyces sp. NPDC093261]|uniref:hypothetical protein n=1 Tax=Streptomyces sp. NPDC093261 TaxID=3366037 RepID=UPI00380645E0